MQRYSVVGSSLAVLAAGLSMVSPGPAGAQGETDAAASTAVDPAACRIDPRAADEIPALWLDPGAAPADLGMPPAAQVVGEEADAETVDAIATTVGELYACTNAGDFARLAALFTDEGAIPFLFPRDSAEASADEIRAALEAVLTASSEPQPEDRQITSFRLSDVHVLDDGRVSAWIEVDSPADAALTGPVVVLFERVGDRYLIAGGYVADANDTAP